MDKELKVVRTAYTKSVEDRSVTGVFSVFGNVDNHNDIVHNGTFQLGKASDYLFLWMHDEFSPAVAVIDDIKEVSRDELPEQVLAKAPDATGGMLVTRRYLNTPIGNQILEGYKEGVPYQMSFMYKPTEVDFKEVNGDIVRNIRKAQLFEVSDVTFGANPATIGSKGLKDRNVKILMDGTKHTLPPVENEEEIREFLDLNAELIKLNYLTSYVRWI